MCGKCVLYGGKREIITEFLWGNLNEKGHWEDRLRREDDIKVAVNEGGIKWIDLAEYRSGGAINLRNPLNVRIFLSGGDISF